MLRYVRTTFCSLLVWILYATPHAWADREMNGPGSEDRSISIVTADAHAGRQSAIREAQGLLSALGYAPGPVTGVWTDATDEAYRAFQRDIGQTETSRLDACALRVLRAVVASWDAAFASPRFAAGATEPQSPPRPAAVESPGSRDDTHSGLTSSAFGTEGYRTPEVVDAITEAIREGRKARLAKERLRLLREWRDRRDRDR